MDVERSDDWFGLEQVFQHFMDLGVLRPMVAFGILSGIPEAQSQYAILFRVRDENNLVHEATLFFQDRHGFFIDGV